MKGPSTLLSAFAFALSSLAGANMPAPAAAYAEPVCGGSIDDWRDLAETTSYSGTVEQRYADSPSSKQSTVHLKDDTVWVPGFTDTVTYTFTAGKLSWSEGGEHGSRGIDLSAPECAQGGTRVTSALYTESEGGFGGASSWEGRLTRA